VGNSGDGNVQQLTRTTLASVPLPRARRCVRGQSMGAAVRLPDRESGAEMKTGAHRAPAKNIGQKRPSVNDPS
jgi:hypothetical protein